MLKYILGAALAFAPTAAAAQNIIISTAREGTLTEAAKVVCRAAMESKGPASEALQREAAYLRLNADEQLYLLSLCILYAQGRIDQIRSQR